jgi:putative ABC transport system ATP-binding protein
VIQLRQICKSFPLGPLQIEVLKAIDLDIAAGEMVAIRGASGGGKSTLLNIIGLLDAPTSGTYRLGGVDVLQADDDHLSRLRNRQIGCVFQQFFLLPHLSALDNVGLPLLYRNLPPAAIRIEAKKMLERVGLGDRGAQLPNQLSGGQQQRVAIARALVGSPKLLIADEPTGSLDPEAAQGIVDLLISLNRAEHVTILIATHDADVAGQCRRQLTLANGLTFSS